MTDFVGDDVLHRSRRRLYQLPVDTDDAVLAAGAPRFLLLAKLNTPRCFRHRVLLRRQLHSPIVHNDEALLTWISTLVAVLLTIG